MNKIILYLVITLFVTAQVVPAQQEDYKKLFEDAEFFFATEEYKEALYLFQQLLSHQPDNHNLNFRAGMCFLNIEGEETMAIPFLEKASGNTSLKYKARDYRETKAPHHTWFYLGNAYRINNEPDKALASYQTFKDLNNFEKHYNSRIVDAEIKAAERAKIISDAPINYKLDNPGKTINNGSRNYNPVLNSSETVIFYMQSQRFYEAVMYSYKQNGEWVEPINITPQVGSDGDMIPTGVSEDGKSLLLIRRTNTTNGDIYLSRLDGNLWSVASKLPSPVNSNKNESHASFSADGKWLVFCSDRSGTAGGLDIWFSEILADGNFANPVNVGNTINTEADENSAYLTQDQQKLFFTSTGHFNMGGYDIFFSEKRSDNTWSDAVNIGFPVNTTNDNKSFQPVGNGTSGYIALYKHPDAFGPEDIFRVEILPLTEPTVPAKNPFRDDFSIFLEDESSGEIIEILYKHETDTINVNSSKGKSYKIRLHPR
jgi:tetratricopeptide (TPR) repeat protein